MKRVDWESVDGRNENNENDLSEFHEESKLRLFWFFLKKKRKKATK